MSKQSIMLVSLVLLAFGGYGCSEDDGGESDDDLKAYVVECTPTDLSKCGQNQGCSIIGKCVDVECTPTDLSKCGQNQVCSDQGKCVDDENKVECTPTDLSKCGQNQVCSDQGKCVDGENKVECTPTDTSKCKKGQDCSNEGKCVEHVVKCGDGVAEGDEMCDLDDLKGLTCKTAGDFVSGSLKCHECKLDTSECNECDDDVDCEGRTDGKLSCFNSVCSLPPACQDGVINQTYESCDIKDFGGKSCKDYGYVAGELACSDECDVDTSGCFECTASDLSMCSKGESCINNRCGIACEEDGVYCNEIDGTLLTCQDHLLTSEACPSSTPYCKTGTSQCSEIVVGEECNPETFTPVTDGIEINVGQYAVYACGVADNLSAGKIVRADTCYGTKKPREGKGTACSLSNCSDVDKVSLKKVSGNYICVQCKSSSWNNALLNFFVPAEFQYDEAGVPVSCTPIDD